jgi:hypothetical protein
MDHRRREGERGAMMRFQRVPKPEGFEAVEAKGADWLASHAHDKRPPSLWLAFQQPLADGFGDLCGYSALYVANGEVDHFVSRDEDRSRTYDWNNYRYAAGWLNASKKSLRSIEILDPFDVEDDWFEILLPSLQLVVTDAVPPDKRAQAECMLTRLHLGHDERVMKQRREWYRMYMDGEIASLDALARKAPLIARAIAKQRRAV